MSKETGGQAFPRPDVVWTTPDGEQNGTEGCEGMTLRDYFAAKAMQGLIIKFSGAAGYTSVHIATDAYTIADSVLKERDK